MKSLLRSKFLLTAGLTFGLLFAVCQRPTFGQSAFYDLRFTDGQSLPAGDSLSGNALNIQAGTPHQTVTFDIWLTVVGGSTTDATQSGLEQADFKGFSQVASGGGAFTTGATGGSTGTAQVGAVSVVGLGAFAGHVSGHGAPTITFADNGSTNGTTASSTKDLIFDMGTASTATGDLALAMGGTASTVFASNANATPTGGSSANGGGWQFDIGRVTFNLGTASAVAGATTSFVALNPNTTSAAIVSINGGTSFQTLTSGTTFTRNSNSSFNSLNFVVVPAAVTGALEDNSNTAGVFGPPQSFSVAASGPYNVVDSSVVGQVSGTTGGNTAFPPSGVGGRARILAGTNSSATGKTVTMGWRSRLVPSEVSPAQHPPMADSVTTGLISDVVDLNGLGNPSDPFVLDMTYNPALLPKHNAPGIETSLANNKLIYMVSPLSGVDGTQYVNTVAVNTGNVVTSPLDGRYGYVGSYAAFQADAAGGNGGTPGSELGAWGVDTALHEVWAVVDHNSTFAVVPEPSTMLLAGFGLLGLVGLRRRLKKVA